MRLSSHKLQRETHLELPMTSMIDVVFLLLIFFMTTSAFVKTERELGFGNQSQSGGRQRWTILIRPLSMSSRPTPDTSSVSAPARSPPSEN